MIALSASHYSAWHMTTQTATSQQEACACLFMRPVVTAFGPDSSVNAPLVTFSCAVGLQGQNPAQGSGAEHLGPFYSEQINFHVIWVR